MEWNNFPVISLQEYGLFFFRAAKLNEWQAFKAVSELVATAAASTVAKGVAMDYTP